MRVGIFALVAAALLSLTACGDSKAPADGDAASIALKALDDGKIGALLSTEAKAALDILGQGARSEIAAYKAQYGKLPETYAELASMETARTAAVTAVADAMAEQVPFVRRETLEQVAGQFVDRAQRHAFEQIKAQETALGAGQVAGQ